MIDYDLPLFLPAPPLVSCETVEAAARRLLALDVRPTYETDGRKHRPRSAVERYWRRIFPRSPLRRSAK